MCKGYELEICTAQSTSIVIEEEMAKVYASILLEYQGMVF